MGLHCMLTLPLNHPKVGHMQVPWVVWDMAVEILNEDK